MAFSVVAILLAILLPVQCKALPTLNVQIVKPQFTFKTAVGATKWGLQTAQLKLNYSSTDPKVAAAARLQVNKLALQFQKNYQKQWPTAEAPQRLKAFTNNLWRISEINKNSKKTQWWAAITEYADLTSEEFAAKYLMKNLKIPAISTKIIPSTSVLLGSGFSWDTLDKVTSVKNQYNCGSCWAFAANAALESRYLIKKGLNASTYTDLDLSEQQLVDCTRSPRTDTANNAYTSGGCSGGWSTDAFDYVRKYNVTFEPNYPYTAMDGTCKQRVFNADGSPAKVLKQSVPNPGYFQVTSSNVTAMKAAIRNNSPIAFYMRVEADFHLYSGGIYTTACTGTKLNHAMLIYGWYTPILSGSTPYWLVKNSWGTGWGIAGSGDSGGHMKLKMDTSSGGLNDGLCRSQIYSYYPNELSTISPISLLPIDPTIPIGPVGPIRP